MGILSPILQFVNVLQNRTTKEEVQDRLYRAFVENSETRTLEIPDREEFYDEKVFEEIEYSVDNVLVTEKKHSGILSKEWVPQIVLRFETDSLLKYDARESKQAMKTWLRGFSNIRTGKLMGIDVIENSPRGVKVILVFDTIDFSVIKESIHSFDESIQDYFTTNAQLMAHTIEEHGSEDYAKAAAARLGGIKNEEEWETYAEMNDKMFDILLDVKDMPNEESE